MLDVVNYILGLGAAIFLPVIMIILGLCMGMKLKKAIIAGVTLGIAFTGMNVVLGFMYNAIGPAATALVNNTGLELTAVDVGWSPIAAIAWAWPYALLLFPLQIEAGVVGEMGRTDQQAVGGHLNPVQPVALDPAHRDAEGLIIQQVKVDHLDPGPQRQQRRLAIATAGSQQAETKSQSLAQP